MEGFRVSLYSNINKHLRQAQVKDLDDVNDDFRDFATRKNATQHKYLRPTLCLTSEPVIYDITDSDDDVTQSVPSIVRKSSSDSEEQKNLLKGRTVWFDEHIDPEEAIGKQGRCIKNLLLHSISTMFVFTPYMTLQHLRVGIMNQAWGYFALLASCVVAPIIVHLVGYKRTIVISFLTHLIFVLSNLINTIRAAFPTVILVGLASGPFWTAQGSYVSLLASEYSEYGRTDLSATTCAFFGIFFVFYHASRILGRPVAYYLLTEQFREGINNRTMHEGSRLDDVINNNITIIRACGRNFCPEDHYSYDRPETAYDVKSINKFIIGYVIMCCAALVITIFFVDDKRPMGTAPNISMMGLARSIAYMHCKEMLLLMLPLVVYTGLEHTYIHWDYLNAFVRCNLGFGSVGPVLLVLGLTETGSTIVIGFLHTYPKCRFTLLELVSFINIILLSVARSTDTSNWVKGHYYIFSIFWGFCHATWQTSICALVALSFSHCRSPAFATFRLWQALAIGAGLSANKFMCMDTKLSLYITVLVMATLCFVVLERKIKKRSAMAYVDLYRPLAPGDDHVKIHLQRLLSI